MPYLGFQIGIMLWSSEDAHILVKDESDLFTIPDSDSGMIRFKEVNTPLEELKENSKKRRLQRDSAHPQTQY